MKSSYKVLITMALGAASVVGAYGQAAAGVRSVEALDGVDQPSLKTTARRLQAIASGPSAQIAVGEYPVSVYGYSSRSSSDSVPPVVIQFGAKDASAIGAMEEDLTVMTHIIDRAVDRVGEDVPDEKLGVKLYYTSGGRSVRALYLDGFGPLIMVKVNFPVHSPTTNETKTPETPQNSEWEQAKISLYGGGPEIRWSGSGVPYDAGRVEVLKKHLIVALKNASNMKGVKPEESVSVTVFGSPAGFGARTGMPSAANSLPGERISLPAGHPPVQNVRASTTLELARTTLQGTVLTLRAKKSDIDAAAKGSLDDDAFAKKVTVNTYSGNGYGLKSVNSWIRSSSSSSYQAR